MSKVMANYGKAFGDPAKKLAVNIALEQITGNAISSGFSNAHTERGHEQEPEARTLYASENFHIIENGGFFSDGKIGCSPDGLVGKEGVIEIKSVIPSVHYETIKRGSFDAAYKWQLICNMYFPGREWIDFVSYCADFPEGKKLYTHRMFIADFSDECAKVDERVCEFFNLVNDTKNKILNGEYST
jgi:hypothetical protein